MKGVVNIEFIMAAFLFLGSISFVMLSIGREFFSFREASVADNYMQENENMLQMLMFDRGYPENWNAGDVKRLGLSSGEKFILDKNKIDILEGLCDSSYEKVKDLLGVMENVIISIKGLDGALYLDCKPAVEALTSTKLLSEGYAVVIIGNDRRIVTVGITTVVQ